MRKMKKRLLLFVCLISANIMACSSNTESKKEAAVAEFCKEYVTEYDVIEAQDNGEVLISVEAPDFEKIAKMMLEEGNEEVDIDVIKDMIEEYPEYRKEYMFSVANEETSVIEEEFLQHISYELMVTAIKEIKYEEKWSVEE